MVSNSSSRVARRQAASQAETDELQSHGALQRSPLDRAGGNLASLAGDRHRPFDPTVVTALQRTHGNARVQRLLAPAGVPQVQRDATFDPDDYRNDEVIDTALLGKDKVPLFKVNDDRAGSNWNTRYSANVEARRVIHQFNGCEHVHEDWLDALNVLETHEGEGEAAHGKVDKAGGAIGARARGQSGEYSRTRIENYLKAVRQADAQLRKLGEKRDDVANAITHVQSVLLGKERTSQEGVVEQGKEDVKEVEDRIEKQKEFLGDALDLLSGLADPKEWVQLAVDTAIFVGKQAVDAYFPTSKLDQLKKDLKAAKKKLVSLEDAEIASQLEEAAGRLNATRRALQNERETYLALFDNLRLEQKTLIEVLEKSSSTKGAAGAIKEQGMVAKTALTAEKLIKEHRDLSALLLGQIEKLETDYRTLHSLASQTTNKPAAYVDHFTVVPASNVDHLYLFKQWLAGAQSSADDDLAYLAAGSYLSGYDAIPATLQSALENR